MTADDCDVAAVPDPPVHGYRTHVRPPPAEARRAL